VRRCLVWIALLVWGVAAWAAETEQAGISEFRGGWREVASPGPRQEGKGALQVRQEALQAAIPHLEAAVSAEPKNIGYLISLGYVYLSAGKYQQAKETLFQATERDRKNPLPYLLRAQAEAALAFMNPDTKAEEIGTALRSFDDAAHLDPTNSLALIQASSVAFEVGKQEVALAKLEGALARPGMTLYRLPIPGDLSPDTSTSIKIWQHAQMWQWLEMVARCQNVARMLLKEGKQKEDASDLDGAEAVYKQVLALGRQVGNARPNLFITVSTALNIMEDAYISLARVAEAKKSREVEAWNGERGVVAIGREELLGQLQAYSKRLEDDPPSSVDDTLELEARSVAWVMRGVGLSPTHEPLPLGQRGQTPEEAGKPGSSGQK
jgi:tetratricopeptide (TPR) repeat protein